MNKLIVFLGNPGIEYEFTRHNIAWLLCDQLSFESSLIWKEKFKGFYSQTKTENGDSLFLLKPLTFMNLSGESIQAIMSFFKINFKDILVVHDELDFKYGIIAFKDGGGLAGHNGLKSTAKCCGGNSFKRLRMGIGRPVHGSPANWVLGQFKGEEENSLEEYLLNTSKAIDFYLKYDFKKVLTKFNKKLMITNITN